eukprot:1139954-Pelagomonas_calceolata.AAC.2
MSAPSWKGTPVMISLAVQVSMRIRGRLFPTCKVLGPEIHHKLVRFRGLADPAFFGKSMLPFVALAALL